MICNWESKWILAPVDTSSECVLYLISIQHINSNTPGRGGQFVLFGWFALGVLIIPWSKGAVSVLINSAVCTCFAHTTHSLTMRERRFRSTQVLAPLHSRLIRSTYLQCDLHKFQSAPGEHTRISSLLKLCETSARKVRRGANFTRCRLNCGICCTPCFFRAKTRRQPLLKINSYLPLRRDEFNFEEHDLGLQNSPPAQKRVCSVRLKSIIINLPNFRCYNYQPSAFGKL